MTDRLDVIIFGATGFTGKATVVEAIKVLSKHTWGIAGRNENKLKEVLKEAKEKSGTSADLSNIPIIIADTGDDESLSRMAKSAKVIVNCCGPYRLYGEPVVRACIDAGTHHLDISGEVQFIEGMQFKYNDLAREKGVYIVSTCGFDSIPAELGVQFVERNFDGQINSIDTYLERTSKSGAKVGESMINYGTWASLVYAIGFHGEIRCIREKLFSKKLPEFKPKVPKKSPLHKSPIGQWSLPFPGADPLVVERTQRFFWETEKKRPIQYTENFTLPNIFAALAIILFGIFIGLLSKFEFGRSLLLNYPSLFSLGVVSTTGPSDETRKNSRIKLTFYARGWSKAEKLAEPTDQYSTPPNKTLTASVTITDPGYTSTAIGILVSAKMILNEREKIPSPGGVLTPGVAFGRTSMIDNLVEYGYQFE